MGMPPCWTPACPLCGYTIASSSAFLSEPISDLIGGTASYLAMRASVWKELCRLEALEPSHGPASDPV